MIVKDTMNGIKIFAVLVAAIYILNLSGIRVFADSAYTYEALGMFLLLSIFNIFFMKL
ncbi:hypothetical protein KKG83_06870 [Candidatus Micrarchaeota archaeon]|nr:hypothetical protein [Candidatus Micrarchaeota archaeon]MBU2477166.1 hypothetical protein [Candidatus Micrarchaeota archaeon]